MASMTVSENLQAFQQLLRLLGDDFDHRMIHDEDFLPDLPNSSYIALQLAPWAGMPAQVEEFLDEFNRWSVELCRSQMDAVRGLCIARLHLRPLVRPVFGKALPRIAEEAVSCEECELITC